MVYYCFIKGCTNSTYESRKKSCEKDISWHGLPKDKDLKKKWAQALGVDDIPKSSRICSEHFSSDCFQQIGLSKRRLKSNALPLFPATPKASSDPLQDMMIENDAAVGNADILEPNKRLKENSLASVSLQLPVKKEDLTEMSSSVTSKENNFEQLTKTPTKSATNTIRYPGDISEEKIKKMSPETIVESMLKLKKSCFNKATQIKRLQRVQRSHLRKIKSMQLLLTDLRKLNYYSKELSCREPGRAVRHLLNKTILFKGQ